MTEIVSAPRAALASNHEVPVTRLWRPSACGNDSCCRSASRQRASSFEWWNSSLQSAGESTAWGRQIARSGARAHPTV